jgi:hypothetical protein
MLTLLALQDPPTDWPTAPGVITIAIGPLIVIAAGLLLVLLVGVLALIVIRQLRRPDRPRSSHKLAKVLLASLAMAAGAIAVLARAPEKEMVQLNLRTEPEVAAEVWIDGQLLGQTPLTLTRDDLRPLLESINEDDPLVAADMIGSHLCLSRSQDLLGTPGEGRLCPNAIGLHFSFHALTVERSDGTQLWMIHKNDLAGGSHATLQVELRDAETGEVLPYRRDEWTRDRMLNIRRYRHTFLFGPSRRIDFDNG